MKVKLLRFPHKQIRAQIIKGYMQRAGYDKAVCFSCGNAAKALEDAGVDVLHIGANGVLAPKKWFTEAEIHKAFSQYFDATSGHLPMGLMAEIAGAYAEHLGRLEDVVYVPTGSGETLVALCMAYPGTKFVAVYNLDDATRYEPQCVMNRIVELLAYNVIKADADGVEESV